MLSDSYAWLRGGTDRDVVVYSRLRLVRNCKDYLFPSRASASESAELRETCMNAVRSIEPAVLSYAFESLDAQSAAVLRERRWSGKGDPFDPSRAVLYDPKGMVYSVNDRDHLRFAVILGGADLHSALDILRSVDRRLDGVLDWACTRDLGFLTSDPRDVGTGFGISSMVFIPGIVEAKIFERVARGLLDGGIEPRFVGSAADGPAEGIADGIADGIAENPADGIADGIAGSPADSGDISPFVELRYRCPLGIDEEEAVESFRASLGRLAEGERRTRERLLSVRRPELEDSAYRAAAILASCRLLAEEEGRGLLTDLRRGLVYGVAPAPEKPAVDDEDPYAPLDRTIPRLGTAQVNLWAREIGIGDDGRTDKRRAELVRNVLPQYHIGGGIGCSKD